MNESEVSSGGEEAAGSEPTPDQEFENAKDQIMGAYGKKVNNPDLEDPVLFICERRNDQFMSDHPLFHGEKGDYLIKTPEAYQLLIDDLGIKKQSFIHDRGGGDKVDWHRTNIDGVYYGIFYIDYSGRKAPVVRELVLITGPKVRSQEQLRNHLNIGRLQEKHREVFYR